MQGPVSIGVIGLGFGQQVHVPAFRAAGGVVAAICARQLERAQTAARELKIPKACGDWRELIADTEIEAISVAVPPPAQAAIVLAAVQTGKHVFCEKPLATSGEQARQIYAEANKAGVVHAMDFIFPEIEAWRKTRELLNDSSLGHLRHAALTWRLETYAHRAKVDNWKRDAAAGGGTLGNFASHTLHYLEWFFGPITRLTAKLSPDGGKAEARVEAWMEFAAGFSATVSVAADAFLGSGHRLEVYGEDGSLVLENKTADWARGFTLATGTRQIGKLVPVEVATEESQADGRIYPVSRIARRFLEAIRSGREATPNLRDGCRVQALMDAIRVADQGGSWQAVAAQ